MSNSYLLSVVKQFQYYKMLGDTTIERLDFEQLNHQFSEDDNSVAIIAKHLAGNMLSRWTNFMSEDGEKPWRNRDSEFEANFKNKQNLIEYWEQGWSCLFSALNNIEESDLEAIIYIRNQGHTVTEAINRQLAHYSYHIGQMVFIGKLLLKTQWLSLSIPKGNSKSYNSDKFNKDKGRRHFTDDL